MAYTVNGYIDGVSYQATVGGDQPAAQTGVDTGVDTGVVSGSPNVLALLSGNVGGEFSTTVTGETVPLDLGQPDTILPALQSLTEVTSVEGDAPVDDDFDASVIY